MSSQELTTIANVTFDRSALRSSVGYWSGQAILFNPTEQIVVLDTLLDGSSLVRIAKDTYRANAHEAVKDRMGDIIKSIGGDFQKAVQESKTFSTTFLSSHLRSFERRGLSEKRWRVSWPDIARDLEFTYPDDQDSQRRFLIDEITRDLLDGLPVVTALSKWGTSWINLGSPSFVAILDRFLSKRIEEVVGDLSILRSFSWRCRDQKHSLELAREFNPAALSCLRKYGLPFSELRSPTDAMDAQVIARAAELLLTCLAYQKSILLPMSAPASFETCILTAGRDLGFGLLDEPDRIAHPDRPLLRALLSTSTARGVADLPTDVKNWLTNLPASNRTTGLFKSIIERFQQGKSDLPLWPLAKLHGTRAKVSDRLNNPVRPLSIYSMHGPAWGCFLELLDASGKDMQRVQAHMRCFLPWAASRGFTSPRAISVFDLIDPSNPQRKDTFREYLFELVRSDQINEQTARNYWYGASYAFRLVYNALTIRPDGRLNLPDNPFALLENPFAKRRPTKSTKRRLPSSIHDVMIEILLEPDENGEPTYRWARTVCNDWISTTSADNESTHRVWCPSRCALLALLMILPVRTKQARWLDRGLMDACIWDVDAAAYVENHHPLRGYLYPDGSTHIERYGRASGVLQQVSDSILDGVQLGIFVNTNKTQMWDPANRRGYEIPWPYIDPGQETDITPDAVAWLNRPYTIIAQQIKWMDRYCPSPVPVSFADSPDDKKSVQVEYLDLLPAIAPLFADLTQVNYRDDGVHTPYHLPVARWKIANLLNALCVETERRLAAEGRKVFLTKVGKGGDAYRGRASLYELHGLRVAGISRLVEMGIPVNVIQEFVAGHSTAVMTSYYDKGELGLFKAKLLESFRQAGIVNDWSAIREPMSRHKSIWVFNRHQAAYRDTDLLDQIASWITVPGGICPLGGTACDVGMAPLEENPDKVSPGYTRVKGGCGNCRFFSTGPAFVIQQSQAMNEIMLELRGHGRSRKALYERLSELAWTDLPDLDAGQRQKLTLDRQLLKEQIASIDLRCEPLILEWVNRYRMFEESLTRLDEWRQITDRSQNPKDGKFLLIAGSDRADILDEVEVRLERSGDFALVRNILEAAVIQGGLEKASNLSKETCSQFMDQILRVEDCRHLLMDIRDDALRHEAAYLMACMAEHLVGNNKVQEALDNKAPLPLTLPQHEDFRRWIAAVVDEAMKGKNRTALHDQNESLVKVLDDECSQ